MALDPAIATRTASGAATLAARRWWLTGASSPGTRELLLLGLGIGLLTLGRQPLTHCLFLATRWRGWTAGWSDELLVVFSTLGGSLGYLGRRWWVASRAVATYAAALAASRVDADYFRTLFAA